MYVCVRFTGLGLLYSLGLTENLTGLIWYICEVDTQLSAVARLRELALQEPEHAVICTAVHGSGGGDKVPAPRAVPDDWPSSVRSHGHCHSWLDTVHRKKVLASVFKLVSSSSAGCLFPGF